MTFCRYVSAVFLLVALLSGCVSLANMDGFEALQPGDISGDTSSSSDDPKDTEEPTAQQSSQQSASTEITTSVPEPSGISTLPPEWDSLQREPVSPLSIVSFPPPLWLDVRAADGANGTLVVVYENDAQRATRDLDLDGEADIGTAPASGPAGYIVASYDQSRSLVWARPLVVSEFTELFVERRSGDIYIAGTWNGAYDVDIDQNGRPELTAYRDEPDRDDASGFLARLRSDGSAVWARRLVGFSPGDLWSGGDGSIQSVGWVPTLPQYDWERGAADVDGDGAVDLERGQFLLSIGRDGELSIAEEYPWISDGWIAGAVAGPDGSLTIAGTLRSPADIDQDGVVDASGPAADSGRADVFVARYDSDGSLLWAESYASSPRSSVVELAGASDGSFYLAGQYSGRGNTGPDFDADGRSDFPPSARDASFIARFDPDGSFDWSLPMSGVSLSITPDGGLLVPGGPPEDVPAEIASRRPAFDDPYTIVDGRGRVETPDTGLVTVISPSGEIRFVGTVTGNHVRARAVIPSGNDLTIVGTYGVVADLDGDGEYESIPDDPMGGADFKSGPYTPFILSIEAP